MKRGALLLFYGALACSFAHAQVNSGGATHAEQRDRDEHREQKQQEKIAHSSNVEIAGATSFKESELLSQLKEQITSIQQLGLTPARGDDAAFFLALYYRKNGFAQAEVKYAILSGNRLRLDVHEGPRVTIRAVDFVGNEHLASDKLMEYAVGPTRERYSKAEKKLPYVKSDVEEGVDLVRRLYVSEGYLNVIVQAPHVREVDNTLVDLTIAIVEGPRYAFGDVSFSGNTVFNHDALQTEIADIVHEPYTDRRVADIPRRLQAYYKERGYYSVKVDAVGSPGAARGGRVPVRVTISPGAIYYYDGVTTSGLRRLHPGFLEKRFASLHGKKYKPELVDEKFRELMRTGLFDVLQVKPVPLPDNTLQLAITAEEAKSKELGLSLGFDTYAGVLVGASYRDKNFLGTGRPLTTSLEYESRGYKGEILYEDPWLFDTDLHLKARLSALTFDFEGYSKFEIGSRIDLSRKFTKQYEFGVVALIRHDEVTSAQIPAQFLGRTAYQANSIGYTQTLDLRTNPLVAPRGLIVDNTFDYATSAIGSDIEFVRSTARLSYYLSFAPEKKTVDVNVTSDEEQKSKLRRWFEQSQLAFGARVGVIRGLNGTIVPIDERFFNGGSNTVRSFGERDLGQHENGYPIGGEFFSVYNVEYTFPVWGELQAAVFVDAGNLLVNSSDAGLDDMRYAVGLGLRYKLPVGPIRLDYGVNPDRRRDEDFGAFHFSFGFAF
ncbi:MAG TPA: BamA/TamA family outer membrane protein [Chthoniobacterales bacterium]